MILKGTHGKKYAKERKNSTIPNRSPQFEKQMKQQKGNVMVVVSDKTIILQRREMVCVIS